MDRFLKEPGLSDLPAVRENVAGLRRRLTDARTGVLDAGSCRVVDPSASVADIGRAVGRAAAEATDVLLVYYAGHGLVDDRGRLHLATSSTQVGAPKYSALAVDLLREDLGASGAAARVLILDCCFSGRAIDVMAGEEGVVEGQLSIAGTYTMTSSSATTPSYAPAGEQYTAFTRALLAALDSAEPLTLDGIYHAVAADLASRGLPRPRQRATDNAAALSLTRGRLQPTTPDTGESDRARFHRHPELQAREARNGMRGCLSVIAGLCLPLGGVVAWLAHDVTALWGIPAMGGALMLMLLAIKAVAAPFELKEAELIIDRSAITLHNHYRHRTNTLRLAWEDISAVGVIPPARGFSSRSDLFERSHFLVIRPKPSTPDLSALDMVFPAELHKLGYRALTRVGVFSADKDSVLEALDRFAGVPVLHTTQELMNHDPRIREDML